MTRPQGMEFGPGRTHWGCALFYGCLGLVLAIIALFGVLYLLRLRDDGQATVERVLPALVMLLGFGLGAFVLLTVAIRRPERKMILAEGALHIPGLFGWTTVPYRNLDRVTRGMDDAVVISRRGRLLSYQFSRGEFASDEEIPRFIEELTRRITSAS